MKTLLWIVPLLGAALVVALASGLLEGDEGTGGEGDEGGVRREAPVDVPPGEGLREHDALPPPDTRGLTEEEILALPRVAVLPEGSPLPPPLPGGRRRPGDNDQVLRFDGRGPVRAKDVLAALTRLVFLRVRDPRGLDLLDELQHDDAWREHPPLFDEVLHAFRGLGFDVEDHGHVIVLNHPSFRGRPPGEGPGEPR